MSTLAFDASLRSTGWCFQDKEPIAVGRIVTTIKQSESESLYYIYGRVLDLIAQYQPDVVALEDQFLGRNPETFKQLAAVRGSIQTACGSVGLPVLMLTPGTIKKRVAGHGHADKDAVQAAVKKSIEILPSILEQIAQHSKKDDMWDAIAIAITAQGDT